MNIWIVNFVCPPPSLGLSGRHYYFKKYLEEKGHQVTLFTGSAIYNRQVNYFTKKEKGYHKKVDIDGVTFDFIKTRPAKNTIDRLFVIHHFSNKIIKIFNQTKEKPDVVYLSISPELELGLKVEKWCKKHHIPVLLEFRDLFPYALVSLNKIKEKGLINKMAMSYLKKVLYKSTAINYTFDGGKQYLIDNKFDLANGGKIDLDNVFIVHNGIDLPVFYDNLAKYPYKDDDLDNPENKCIVYTGSIGYLHGVNRLLDIAEYIKNPRIKFLIWGSGRGEEADNLVNEINKRGLTNIVYKGVVDNKYIPSITSKSYANCSIIAHISVFKYGISLNKLSSYFAAGKPIFNLCDFAFPSFDRQKAGLYAPSENNQEVARDIEEFVQNTSLEKYQQYGDYVLSLSQTFAYSSLSDEVEKVLIKTKEIYEKK